ncbi:MAG: hypothetical protein ACE5EI_01295 [Thermodesulfobacteriota bacterium]
MLKLALFLHIISAIMWVGGMLFLTLVLAPFLMTIPDPKERSKIYQFVGKKYRLIGWINIILLLVTGPVILATLYGITPGKIHTTITSGTPFGNTLAVKLALVALLVLSSFFHDFFVGPRARNSPGYSRIARIFGRGNLLVALLVVIFAVFLRAGGL